MPGGDRTGPAGRGPMSGRAAGFCAGYAVPGYMNMEWRGYGQGGGWGRGGGRGRGRGFRHRHMYHATGVPGWQRGYIYPEPLPYPEFNGPVPAMTREQTLEMMKRQAGDMERALSELQNRITEMESSSNQD